MATKKGHVNNEKLVVGVDLSSRDDWSVELEYETYPNGTFVINKVYQWRKEIEHDELPHRTHQAHD